MGHLRLCVSGSVRIQLCGDDSCGFCTSSPVGVVYQHRFGSQSEEKCQQHRKLVEMKFSLKRKSRRVDLKIHEYGEKCVLCQQTQIQLNRRCAFCLQSLLRRRSLPSTQREEEEKVWEEKEKVRFYLNIYVEMCKERVKKFVFHPTRSPSCSLSPPKKKKKKKKKSSKKSKRHR